MKNAERAGRNGRLLLWAAVLTSPLTGCARHTIGVPEVSREANRESSMFRVVVDAERMRHHAEQPDTPLLVDTLASPEPHGERASAPPSEAAALAASRAARRRALAEAGLPVADWRRREACERSVYDASGQAASCPARPEVHLVVSLPQAGAEFWTFILPRLRGQRYEGAVPEGSMTVSVAMVHLGPQGRTTAGRDYLLVPTISGWAVDRVVSTYMSH